MTSEPVCIPDNDSMVGVERKPVQVYTNLTQSDGEIALKSSFFGIIQ